MDDSSKDPYDGRAAERNAVADSFLVIDRMSRRNLLRLEDRDYEEATTQFVDQ